MSDERDTGNIEAKPVAAGAPAHGVASGDRVHTFVAPGIAVTWSRKRCTHAAECVMHLPTVFQPGQSPWIDPTAASPEAIARVVMRCPTGSLHFERTDGGVQEPVPAQNTVLASRDGPLTLRGDIEVHDDAGAVKLRDTRVALCRCGLSKTKPLCDNAHREARFRDPGALHDGDSVEDTGAESATLRVIPHENESLELAGPFAIGSADGKTLMAGTSTWLCRCGQSQSKPFCDGSHARVGFKSG